MSQTPILMPQLGESIAEATVIELLVSAGERVEAGQDIIEVETQKATMNVTSPCQGVIESFLVEPGDSYAVGEVLGHVTDTAKDAPSTTQQQDLPKDLPKDEVFESVKPSERPEAPMEHKPASAKIKPTIKGLPVPAHFSGAQYMSPRMKARMHELGLREADLAGVAGSGAGGRVTIQDFERFLTELEQTRLTQASSMRVAVADAMQRSWSRPLATVGQPVCLDPLLKHRSQSDPKPGPALYALRALAVALSENSATAGRLIGHQIAHPASIDIGFAVEADDGVLVPVIREADRKPLQTMVEEYQQLVEWARMRKLPSHATGRSIATITNFGTFGLTWATHIPLPEQTLVLGLGAGRKVPSWNEEKGVFQPILEAEMTLSFDHRVLDGGAAGRLLSRINALMTQPSLL